MTFKHVKFEDSITMRSLEKLAIDKGLSKQDPLQKIASRAPKAKPADLVPTLNLTENIMKLCTGLRENGLEKLAEELESSFITYKKAEHLYETSKEKGEDLVDSAHPKGSHKLEGVEGDSIIETIIDQHLQDLKIVNKKPTGKLTNANDIIGAVKFAFTKSAIPQYPNNIDSATEDELIPWRRESAYRTIQSAKGPLNSAKNLVDSVLSGTTTFAKKFYKNYDEINNTFKQITPDNMNVEFGNAIISDLEDITTVFSFYANLGHMVDQLSGTFDPKSVFKVRTHINSAIAIAKNAVAIMQGKNDDAVKKLILSTRDLAEYQKLPLISELSRKVNSMVSQCTAVINAIANAKTQFSGGDEANLAYLDKVSNYFKKVSADFSKVSNNISSFVAALPEEKKKDAHYNPNEFSQFVNGTIIFSGSNSYDDFAAKARATLTELQKYQQYASATIEKLQQAATNV